MRIALIYTGYLRSWEQCRGTQLNLYTGETDLFFYTYEKPEWGENDFIKPKTIHIPIHEPFFPDPFKEHKYSSRRVPENTVYQSLNQFHNNLISFCLAPLGYDVYVRIRPDLKFESKLDFSKYDCSGNTIYIPEGNDFGGICDQFAFGNREVMKKYYSLYFTCHELWESGAIWHSEGLQLANLNREGVNIVRFGSPQPYIVR